jgi:hypothetical protein
LNPSKGFSRRKIDPAFHGVNYGIIKGWIDRFQDFCGDSGGGLAGKYSIDTEKDPENSCDGG